MRHLFLICIFILQQFTFNSQIPADYSNLDHWLIAPGQTSTIHAQFISDSSLIDYADVFYVYPTVFLDKKNSDWTISIDDKEQRDRAKNVTKFQASAWAESGRMFVPYYSQAHIRSYTNLEDGGKAALLTAYQDVKKAFQYYLEHYNQGRPIILAGHSQGSTHVMLLLKDFFDEKPLQKQLVCAYLPGFSIMEDEFKTIPLLTISNQTGGFVTWNTFKRRYKTKKYKDWYKGKACINPVTWDKSNFATRKKHRGFLFSNETIYENSFNTHLVDGAIWITTPKVPFRSLSITLKDYHIGDVNLFWKDIQYNAAERVNSFREKGIENAMNK